MRLTALKRGLALAVITATSALAVGCGDTSATRDTSTLPGTTAASSTEPAAIPNAPLFNRNMVRVAILSKQNQGGQWEIHFIAKGKLKTHLAQARECVADYSGDGSAQSAFCFAFPSQAAFRFARVDRTEGGMKRLCWSARAGLALSGDRDESDDTIFAFSDGCPS